MRSPFGAGSSNFQEGFYGSAGPVDTVYLGSKPARAALLAVGGFDERFTRAQDWELNYRLRAAGGIVYFDPRLHVTYRPRPTLAALAKQYFEYGRWRRVVTRHHQGTVNLPLSRATDCATRNSFFFGVGHFSRPLSSLSQPIYLTLS